ncbi:unnamed protein product, partial [Tetraodon nigroviridis]
ESAGPRQAPPLTSDGLRCLQEAESRVPDHTGPDRTGSRCLQGRPSRPSSILPLPPPAAQQAGGGGVSRVASVGRASMTKVAAFCCGGGGGLGPAADSASAGRNPEDPPQRRPPEDQAWLHGGRLLHALQLAAQPQPPQRQPQPAAPRQRRGHAHPHRRPQHRPGNHGRSCSAP